MEARGKEIRKLQSTLAFFHGICLVMVTLEEREQPGYAVVKSHIQNKLETGRALGCVSDELVLYC